MMWNRAELKMRGNIAFKKNYVSDGNLWHSLWRIQCKTGK